MMLKQTDIRKARRHLRAADPVMKAVIDAVGPFTLRLERDRFGMLVRSIISQQISTSAARSIRRRLQEFAGPEGMKAATLAQFTVDQLRSVGLSPQKASYVADLARKVNDGTVDLRQIGRLSDERIVEQLTQVKGIGRWTAQMFLIFSLGRLDVFPHDDLGVRTAIRNRYGLADLPDKQTALAIAAPWRPYASVASWYCWRTLDLKREDGQGGERVSDVSGADGDKARFQQYMGIDYSGRGTPLTRTASLQVYVATPQRSPQRLNPPGSAGNDRDWCRREVAEWLIEQAKSGRPFLAGLDFSFSLPLSYFQRYGLTDWDDFLEDFVKHWPTDQEDATVEKSSGTETPAQGRQTSSASPNGGHLRLRATFNSAFQVR